MNVLFAGGRTGGHLYPAVAMAWELLKTDPGVSVSFAGTPNGIEASEVPRLGYRLHLLPVRGLKRGWKPADILGNLGVLAGFAASIFRSAAIINRESPDVVVGTGGFVSAPVLFAAQLMGKKTLIQEQNAFPGVTTRLLAIMAGEIHVSFEESLRFIRRKKAVYVTGNPARTFMPEDPSAARLRFGLAPDLPTLLVFGGSRGARAINNAFLQFCAKLSGRANIIWQTGSLDYERVRKEVSPSGRVWIGPYIEEMGAAYAAADLVVCRAGASTIAELTNLGKPSVLVPYPHATGDHQRHNAEALVRNKAALMVDDSRIGHQDSFRLIVSLLSDSSELARMGAECRKQGYPDAAAKLAGRIVYLAKH